jgi:hypothetical protein
LVLEGLSADQEDSSKLRVSLDRPQLVSINKTLLVDGQGLVAFFQETIESIKYTWIAQISILKHDPVTLFDGIDQH